MRFKFKYGDKCIQRYGDWAMEIKRYKDRHGDKWIQRYVYKYGDYT